MTSEQVWQVLAILLGAARWVLNWFRDDHPQQHKYGSGGERGERGGCGDGNGGGGAIGYPGGERGGCSDGNGGGAAIGYPAHIEPNLPTFNFRGNKISKNKAGVKAFSNFGNNSNGGPNSGKFDFQNNEVQENEGRVEGFQDFGNVH